MLKIAIIGATGYTGIELVRLLNVHQKVEIIGLASRAEAGKKVSTYFPNLRGISELTFVMPDDPVIMQADLIFFATPHGVAMKSAPLLLETGKKVIDLSADFRLKDPQQFAHWYSVEHTAPIWLERAVYGLTELNTAAIATAQLVANPGCYPTIVQLGFAPFLAQNMLDPQTLIADCKSGVSGAGRKADLNLSYCEVADSFKAYALKGHRHQPEIMQQLQGFNAAVEIAFVPHLVPMNRGMFVTLYARLRQNHSLSALQAVLNEYYQQQHFIQILPTDISPETRFVRGANGVHLSLSQQGRQLVITGAQDNLVKGAAGQAVQNMNVMCGFAQNEGLNTIAYMV